MVGEDALASLMWLEPGVLGLGGQGSEAEASALEALLEAFGGMCTTVVVVGQSPVAVARAADRAKVACRSPIARVRPVYAEAGACEALAALGEATPPGRPKTVVWAGCALGEEEPSQSLAQLTRIRRALEPRDRVLITVDCATDPVACTDAVRSPWFRARSERTLARLRDEHCYRLNVADFDYEVAWNAEAGAVDERFVANRPLRHTLTAGDAYDDDGGPDQDDDCEHVRLRLTLEAEEAIVATAWHKHSPESVDALVGNAGLKVLRRWTWSGSEGSHRLDASVSLLVCERA